MQTSKLSHRDRMFLIRCSRDGTVVMTLQCRNKNTARQLSSLWNSGYTQGQMAEYMKENGLRI